MNTKRSITSNTTTTTTTNPLSNLFGGHLNQLYTNLRRQQTKGQEYLYLIENLIYSVLEYCPFEEDELMLNFDPELLINEYTEAINKQCQSLFAKKQAIKAKASLQSVTEILGHKHIADLFENDQHLNEMQILSLNNLCCVYKEMKKFNEALKMVNCVCQIEEKLQEKSTDGCYKASLVGTLLNKASILIEINDVEEAKIIMKSAQDSLEQAKAGKNLDKFDKNYFSYLDILCSMNNGKVCKLKDQENEAMRYYQDALNLAKMSDNAQLQENIQKAIGELQSNGNQINV